MTYVRTDGHTHAHADNISRDSLNNIHWGTGQKAGRRYQARRDSLPSRPDRHQRGKSAGARH